MDKEIIVRKFEETGLRVDIASRPIDPANPHIFQMDIQRRVEDGLRYEYVRIWPGESDGGIRVEVLGIDKGIKQLVLLVQEPEREFDTTHRKYSFRTPAEIEAIRQMGRVVKETATEIVVREKTDPRKRRFLLGVDERQLFIAQIQKGNTVKEAHANLKSPVLVLAEGRVPGNVKRQGEWFFLNLTDEEERGLKDYIKAHPYALRRKQPISPEPMSFIGRQRTRGHPHTAEEIVHIPRWGEGDVTRVVAGPSGEKTQQHGRRVVARPRPYDVYVRGNITHVEHKRMKFAGWRRVIRNNEVEPKSGVMWID